MQRRNLGQRQRGIGQGHTGRMGGLGCTGNSDNAGTNRGSANNQRAPAQLHASLFRGDFGRIRDNIPTELLCSGAQLG